MRSIHPKGKHHLKIHPNLKHPSISANSNHQSQPVESPVDISKEHLRATRTPAAVRGKIRKSSRKCDGRTDLDEEIAQIEHGDGKNLTDRQLLLLPRLKSLSEVHKRATAVYNDRA